MKKAKAIDALWELAHVSTVTGKQSRKKPLLACTSHGPGYPDSRRKAKLRAGYGRHMDKFKILRQAVRYYKEAWLLEPLRTTDLVFHSTTNLGFLSLNHLGSFY